MAASLFLTSSSLPGRAAEAGAWENFNSLGNADAWGVYDYYQRIYDYLDWTTEGGDGWVSYHAEDDWPLWFVTDFLTVAGGGKLIGNYSSENIQSILVDVYIDSPADLGFLLCSIDTTGAFGQETYYSFPFTGEDFTEPGWYSLRFGFDISWIYYGGTTPQLVPADTQFLSNITGIGFYYAPVEGTTQDTTFAIDNVKLEPKVVAPVVTSSVSEGNFSMSFIPGDGVSCYIEQMLLPPDSGWVAMPEHFGLTGTAPYVFTTPIVPNGKEIFRVNYEPLYTPFVTPPATP